MFLVDTSSPMSTLKTVELPGPNGETISQTMTHLEYALRFVKLKVQEMVCSVSVNDKRQANSFASRSSTDARTDQCGVNYFGSEGAFSKKTPQSFS